MTHNFVIALMLMLPIMVTVVLWHTMLVLKGMTKLTHHGIRIGFWLRASGLFMLLLADYDYLVGEPMTWPWLLLTGIVTAITGSALIHVFTCRVCQCGECPLRAGMASRCASKDPVR